MRIKNNPYFLLLKISWENSSNENKKKFILVYVLFIATHGVSVFVPLLYGWFIESLQFNHDNALHYIWIFIGAYLGLTILKWTFHGPGRFLERKLAFELSSTYLDHLVQRLVNSDIDWHKKHHSGAVISRLKKAHIGLRNFFQNGFMYFDTVMSVLIAMTAMIWFAPIYGLIAVAMGLVSMWINFRFDRPYIKSLHRFNEKEHEVSASLSDGLGNILTVITLRLGTYIRAHLQGKMNVMSSIYRRITILGELKWFVANLFVASIYLVIVTGYVYSNYSAGSPFNLGGLVTLVAFVMQFTNAFYMIAHQYSLIVQYYADVNSANIIKKKVDKNYVSSKGLPSDWKELEINNITFSYHSKKPPYDETTNDKSKAPILNDVSLKLERGKHIALIGKSGVGKSTLLALLRGLYTPERHGDLLIDGKPFMWPDLLESTTLFPQDPEIFEHTILFNLTMGLAIDEEEIKHACKLACIDQFIGNLPDGINTIIKERGVNLSGGEKQRLALARGILASKNSHILLMDEPTSNVDNNTEHRIFLNLMSSFPNKVIISTLHNLELVKYFDYQISLNPNTKNELPVLK